MVHAMVNVRGLPCVIPGNMLSAGEERVMNRAALTRSRMNAEEAHPSRAAADRDRTAQGAPSSVSEWAVVTSVLRVVDIRGRANRRATFRT
jgi:hypothetical protein